MELKKDTLQKYINKKRYLDRECQNDEFNLGEDYN